MENPSHVPLAVQLAALKPIRCIECRHWVPIEADEGAEVRGWCRWRVPVPGRPDALIWCRLGARRPDGPPSGSFAGA